MANRIAVTIGSAAVGAAAATAVLIGTQAGAAPTSSAPSSAPTSTSAPSTPAPPGGKHHGRERGERLRNLEHGTWVRKDGSSFVTHTAIQGSVTAVSATSITVKAEDGFTATYTLTSDTKVRAWTNGKPAASTVGAVKVGQHAVVAGTGTSTVTAKHVLVGTR